ncbi:hypothetical protein ACIQCF_33300 [Streptomyces sp. NPDC088353]|uniref:hypothetical protein n=1 Tax=Streptomyces sp. NPDC088353 TaxID=3365855 RepID=UPI0038139CDE
MRRSEQVIDVPERVYRGPHYSGEAKLAWCKVAALDVDGNAEHCNASVANLAAFVGKSKSVIERGLTQLYRPGPDGGEPEISRRRMSHRGGRGRTAIRWVRGVAHDERFVTIPMWIVDAAEPRELEAVLLIAHAQADGHQLTAAELAEELFHHRGEAKGRSLSERTARRIIKRLEAKGFIDVGHRAGFQGRDVLTVRETPVSIVPDTPAAHPAHDLEVQAPGADTGDGSGADSGDGSLASKEDQQVCTDGSTQEGGSFRRRRGDRKWATPTVDTAGSTAAGGQRDPEPGPGEAPAAPRTPSERPQRAPGRPAYTGPAQTLSRRVWRVLEPVHDLLPGVTPFMVRRIAGEIGSQLDSGVLAEDITAQLQLLRGWTDKIADPGAWILGAALPTRPGPCGTTDCIRGIARHTGAPCKACADLPPGYRAGYPPHTPPAAAIPLLDCPGCHAPYRPPLRHPDCRLCGTQLPTAT